MTENQNFAMFGEVFDNFSRFDDGDDMIKVRKSQRNFFLKLHYPESKRNFRRISAKESPCLYLGAHFGTFTQRSVHPTAPVLLTKHPLRNEISCDFQPP